MNPKYHLLAAIAALSLNACSTDDTCTGPEIGGYKISFTVAEDTETRTTLTTGDFLRWLPIDKVGIYTVGENANSNILTTADVNKSPVEFVGTLEQPVSSGDMFYAYYPYNAEQSTDPSVVKLSIPTEQKQTKAGVYNGESHPLVAVPMEFSQEWGSDACRISSVRFRQLGAIVELQLYSSDETLRNEKIRSVTFESETPLAGDFSFDMKTMTVKEDLPISGYESKMATTVLEKPAVIPATKDEAARIYLTIAPGQYTGQIVVRTDVAKYTFRLAKTMTFERAVIKGLPADLAKAEREIFILFEDPVAKHICVKYWDTDADGELSYKEAAAVTDLKDVISRNVNNNLTSFNELQYFTGLQSIGYAAFIYCDELTSIHIPKGVTAIGNRAFYGCHSLANINIPDGVTTIEAEAFSGCWNLTNINIPGGVTEIGTGAFGGCISLTTINIPDGVTAIGDYTFDDCNSLTSIHIPDKVTAIGDWAFDGCSSLTTINIPDGVTTIGRYAFYGCSSLTSIHIPDKVTAIGSLAFSGCNSLTSINIPQTISSIGRFAFSECSSLSAFYGKYASADHRCLIQDGTLLAFAPAGLTEYTIPDGVTSIEKSAFCNCDCLTSINIPDGVTSIRYEAFYDCSSLTSVYCKPTTPPFLGYGAFLNVHSFMKIYVPAASVEAYKTAEGWSEYASQIFAN